MTETRLTTLTLIEDIPESQNITLMDHPWITKIVIARSQWVNTVAFGTI